MADKHGHLEGMASRLAKVVQKTVKTGETPLSLRDDVELLKKNIIEFEGKLRLGSMEKFNAATYIIALSCYRNEEDKAKNIACGAVALYMLKERTGEMLKKLGFRDFDDENDDSMIETCGQFCRQVIESFKKEISQPGLVLSDPQGYLNSVPVGIDFDRDQFFQYEINFFEKDKEEKLFVFEFTMAPL